MDASRPFAEHRVMDLTLMVWVGVVFVLAGAVKGVTGMGLPTVAVSLLGLVMLPAQAAALLVLPSLATNVAQCRGPHARRLVRMPGIDTPSVLDAVLGVMPLDDFVDQAAITMQVVADPTQVPPVVQAFNATLQRHGCAASSALERFAFYQRAAGAFAIVATGERRVYGNILLKKGVVRP